MSTKIRMDKNYNLVREVNNIYTDGLDEKIDLLQDAKIKGIINDEEFKFLFSFIIYREFKKGLNSMSSGLIKPRSRSSSFFYFLNYKKTEEQYA